MSVAKFVEFLGNSLDDLRRFPSSARREAGHQIDQVQCGLEPDHWKPMGTIGSGVREIRVGAAAGAFQRDLRREIRRHHLPASLLPKEDGTDGQS